MRNHSEPSTASPPNIQAILAQLALALPAQPPLHQFTPQNPLYAGQHLHFEAAIAAATGSTGGGGNGYLADPQFRALYQQGRVTDADIAAALAQADDLQAHTFLLDPQLAVTQADVYRIAMLFELEPVLPSQLAWQIEELNTLEKFQPDVPVAVRQRLLGKNADAAAEKSLIADLWELLLNKLDLEQTYLHPENVLDLSLDQAEALLAQHRASQKKVSLKKATMHERMQEAAVETFAKELQRLGKDMSLRNLMMDLCGVDILDNVRPQMIRLCSSGLDEGMAAWQLPGRREAGLYAAWRAVAGLDINPFLHELPDWQAIIAELPDNAEAAITLQLTHLEIPPAQWDGYLRCLALEMPGWSSLINWRGQHPEYTPANDAKPTLADYLAIRLTLDRLWLNQICRDTWQIEATLSSLKKYFRKNTSEYMVRWHLFRGNLPEYLIQQAETMTLSPGKEQYNRSEWQTLADVIWTWQGSSMANSRPLHSIYDSAWQLFRLSQHLALSAGHLHAITKTDLEQVLSVLRAFTPARRRYIGLVAYEWHFRENWLHTLHAHQTQKPQPPPAAVQLIFSMDNRAEPLRRLLEANDLWVETYSVTNFLAGNTQSPLTTPSPAITFSLRQTLSRLWHHSLRGNVLLSPSLMAASFPFTLVGLLAKVFFPHWRLSLASKVTPKARTTPATPAAPLPIDPGAVAKFAQLLQTLGLAQHLSPLVIFVGHTANIQNNHHFAAYQLAATNGQSAAALADFANNSDVRRQLAERGVNIPAATCFIAAEYNGLSKQVTWMNPATLPTELLPTLTELQAVCQTTAQARAANCAGLYPDPAFAPVTAAVIGRRTLTQGLNLEGSMFLVSYDPTQDSAGQHLEQLLLTTLPLLAALNLSYYFAAVDNQRFGSGNSVLHNVIAQLGVMEGAGSDLRYGLPAQMSAQHAAMRLQVLVEASVATLQPLLERQPALRDFIQNGWIHLNARDPETGELFIFNSTGQFTAWRPDDHQLSTFAYAHKETDPTHATIAARGLAHG